MPWIADEVSKWNPCNWITFARRWMVNQDFIQPNFVKKISHDVFNCEGIPISTLIDEWIMEMVHISLIAFKVYKLGLSYRWFFVLFHAAAIIRLATISTGINSAKYFPCPLITLINPLPTPHIAPLSVNYRKPKSTWYKHYWMKYIVI